MNLALTRLLSKNWGGAATSEKKVPLTREFGISRETLYQYLREPSMKNIASESQGG